MLLDVYFVSTSIWAKKRAIILAKEVLVERSLYLPDFSVVWGDVKTAAAV